MKGGDKMSSVTVTEIDPTKDSRWDYFVESHPSGTIYHHSVWLKLLKETYDLDAMCFALQGEGGVVRGILPVCLVRSWLTGSRLVSLPFSLYGGPIVSEAEDTQVLVQQVQKLSKELNVDHIQLRCGIKNALPTDKRWHFDRYYRTHILDLRRSCETLFSSFHKSTIRRGIMKSMKGELSVKAADDERDVHSFYALQVKTRKKHGVPPQPLKYFQNMWRILGVGGHIKLLLSYHRGSVVAAIILLRFKKTVIYQNGASNQDFLALRPNHLLLWNAIRSGKEEGFTEFDFGKSAPGDEGLIDFKRRWGTKEHFLPYYNFPYAGGKTTNLETSAKYRFARTICRNTPEPILRIMGSILYRHYA
jgi:CelD/BcsL family acetyltransferase involved in cellulose biosynthesis